MTCYKLLGEIDKASLDANILLKINPNCPVALHARGGINKLKGKYDDAYLDFKKSLDIMPDFGDAKLNCALVKRNIDGHIESMGNIPFISYNEIRDIRPLNGDGGFGEIFQATWVNYLGEEKKVALKYLRTSKGYSINIINEIHEHKLIHRDLHSKNILICKNGGQELTKIGDLGLTRLIDDVPISENKIYGVMPYLDPQLLAEKHEKKYTQKSDVFHNADKKIIESEHSNKNDDNTQILRDSWDFSNLSEILMPDTLPKHSYENDNYILRDSSHLFEILKLDTLLEHSNEK
ncbi:13113_t:CDS:2 [Racocetra fulgida]|uniref:non-specific serine/threonine protein kinase n=1 Tax=Racocetra fulgida TaxID=60492 RepID=A0A9N8YUQ0_9GLOM|nr:13113_t:CDS:2 [Racocetra fulgida]